MITFQDTYDNRKKEIENFLELMAFLEKKENQREDGESEFDKFFYHQGEGISMTYQELINILKSNVSLMLYNIIEYTVSNLIDSIYDEIRRNHLSYVDVNVSIRALWRKTILKAANDPNANFNTFLKKNEEVIDAILQNSILELRSRNTMPAGNLDGVSIKEAFESHGVQVQTASRNYRPDILIRDHCGEAGQPGGQYPVGYRSRRGGPIPGGIRDTHRAALWPSVFRLRGAHI